MTTSLGQWAPLRPTHVHRQWREHGPDPVSGDLRMLAAAVRDRLRCTVGALEAVKLAMATDDLTQELGDRLRSHAKLLARSVGLLVEDLLVVHTHRRRDVWRTPEVVPLTGHLERAVSLFPNSAITLDAGSELYGVADPLRLQQLVVNLLRGTTSSGHPVRLTILRDSPLVLVRFRYGGRVRGHELAMSRLLASLQGVSLHLWPDDECTLEVAVPLAEPPRAPR